MLKIIFRSLLILIFLQIPAAFSQSIEWKISQISGEVLISTSGGLPQKMSATDSFTLGQKITVGKNGSIALTKGQQAIILSANSQLEIPSDKDANNQQSTTFFQTLGSIIFSAKKRSKNHFKVQTPFAAAVVKGTTFAIHVSKSDFNIQVFEGSVELKGHSRQEKHLLLAGTKATVVRNFSKKVKIIKDKKQHKDNTHFGNDTDKIKEHYTQQLLIVNKHVTVERNTIDAKKNLSNGVTVTHTKKMNNNSSEDKANENSSGSSASTGNSSSNSSSSSSNSSDNSSSRNNSSANSSSSSSNSSDNSSSNNGKGNSK